MPRPALVWFRQDLRLADNPALGAARKSGAPLAFIYVLDDETPGRWKAGGASCWWLHHSLLALGDGLAQRGGRLLLRRGSAETVIPRLAAEIGAGAVYWNRCYEPFAIERDTQLKKALPHAESFGASLLREPWELETGAGGPYKVFTPFWKALRAVGPMRAPLPAPRQLNGFVSDAPSDQLDAWGLLPRKPNWAAGFERVWTPGEAGAHAALKRFISQRLSSYPQARDIPADDATSRLSPHLHWGEISPVQIWAAAEPLTGADKFLSEIAWRDFAHHLLFHFPHLAEAPWRNAFADFPWRDNADARRAWFAGETGYPIVDAGMRELWATGYMHNRVRMIAASFFTKHLLEDWRLGADWFWDTLVDADLANNSASWQWVAGSGADAAPYFRIFNPTSQGERFDPEGAYVRRWVPELASLSNAQIHRPWEASHPPRDYPAPIVDHAAARARALEAYSFIKTPA